MGGPMSERRIAAEELGSDAPGRFPAVEVLHRWEDSDFFSFK
jgi:hypothetical protein